MRNGIKVFDADAHVLYPMDLWDRFLDPKFKHRVKRVKMDALGDSHYPHATSVDGRYTQITSELVKNLVAPTKEHVARWRK